MTSSEKATNPQTGPFYIRIKTRMNQLGMKKLEEFAEYSNIGATTVYNLVLGRVSSHGGYVKPSVDTLVKLAEALDVPLYTLLYELEPQAKGAADLASLRQVRLYHAGWNGAKPNESSGTEDNYIWVEDLAPGMDLVAFRVHGDSMAAGRAPIHHGDTVIVDRNDKGFDTASVVVKFVDGSYLCKMLKDDKFGRLLQSRNPEHTNGTPSVIPVEQVDEIVGRVVRIIHDEIVPKNQESQ